MLLELLTNYEPLFDGTLDAWKTTPGSFELKEGAKPYHGRAFPIPKVLKETIMKEIRRLCILLHGQPPKDISEAKDFIDEALSISMHAMRLNKGWSSPF